MWIPNVTRFHVLDIIFAYVLSPLWKKNLTSDVSRRLAPGQLMLVAAMRGRLWRALNWWCHVVLNGSDALILKGKLEVTRGIGPRSRGRTAYKVLVYLRECERIRVTQFLKIHVAIFFQGLMDWFLASCFSSSFIQAKSFMNKKFAKLRQF